MPVPKTRPAVLWLNLPDGLVLPVRLCRSARKTLALHVTAEGIEARAPLRMPRLPGNFFTSQKSAQPVGAAFSLSAL